MDYALTITDKELDDLKSQIEVQRKKQEYAKLKKDLFDISFKANHTLTEFDGGMQQVDTAQVLKTKRNNNTFSELFINRILKMCNVRPIVGNIIALSLAIVGVLFLQKGLNNPDLGSLKMGLAYLLEGAAAVQIIKSASRSIVLPIMATVIGVTIANQLTGNHLFLNHPSEFFQGMMITGLVGIAISVFSID